MRKTLLSSALAALAFFGFTNVHALDKCFTGSWYEPATSGNGVVLDITPAAEVAYIYTFKDGNPQWFVAQKPDVTDESFNLYSVHGLHINAPKTGAEIVGKVDIVPVDANTITYRLKTYWPTEFCSGFGPHEALCDVNKTLVRLTQPVACETK